VIAEDLRRAVDADAPWRLVAGHLERARELGLDAVNRLLYVDLLTYVPGDLLRLADRTSMQVGLEVRVPFLDHRLVEAALAVPGREKLRHRRGKLLLRRIARSWLPPEIVRAPKRGFGVPMGEWLRGPLALEVTRVIEQVAPATGVLDRPALRAAWDAHRSGRANHEDILFATLVFARFVESR
jgi:asparagine synthase (glutamine-hydrolysing)